MSTKHTPLMQQYHEIKAQYPDALLLFQVGDFYELFYEDAQRAAAYLAIALTARGKDQGEPIPLCGVPLHAINHYVAKLVKGGFNVAICNQLEAPRPGSVVKRGVVQVLTPGTLTDATLLEEKKASYLLSFFPMENAWGLLFGELLTAQLFATVLKPETYKSLEAELSRFLPDEIIVPSNQASGSYFEKNGFITSRVAYYQQDRNELNQWISTQFSHEQAKHLMQHDALIHAMHNMFGYLQKTQVTALDQFKQLHFYNSDDYLMLDTSTQRNLELLKNLQDNSRKHSLLSILDGATTAMGSRTISKWIMRPLIDKDAIMGRQDAIESLLHDVGAMQQLKKLLLQVGDVERVVGRIALNRGSVHDYLALKKTLTLIPEIKLILNKKSDLHLLKIIAAQCIDFAALYELLDAALNEDPVHDWIIKAGFDQRLDRLRDIIKNSRSLILDLEKKEQEVTGINSLKIRYNHAHGYYIEVTKTNLDAVPAHYQRSQTLVGKERYITEELKKLQAEILTADQQISAVEKELYDSMKLQVRDYANQLRKCAYALANLDALIGLTSVAYLHGYVRPTFNDENKIIIRNGRHPVIEQALSGNFIPNDTILHNDHALLIITGPNMGGKSTYLRQVALICIMAQIGSFVPAESADIAIRDRIFTRIGASDNVAAGKSTFLVEMEETAQICIYATELSLIILDEVGRGTSTYDGLAIAQAVVEYIATVLKARCLFATHYHELTVLHEKFKSIIPYYAASKQTTAGITFLHKMKEGVADGSFGLEVARLADLPGTILNRAHQLLQEFKEQGQNTFIPAQKYTQNSLSDNNYIMEIQCKISELESELAKKEGVLAEIAHANLNELSPKQAFDLIWKIREII